jgi:hypothetical protein
MRAWLALSQATLSTSPRTSKDRLRLHLSTSRCMMQRLPGGQLPALASTRRASPNRGAGTRRNSKERSGGNAGLRTLRPGAGWWWVVWDVQIHRFGAIPLLPSHGISHSPVTKTRVTLETTVETCPDVLCFDARARREQVSGHVII